jgi:cobalt-zinc-cadmium efflux system membrane fusion protein
MKNKCIELIVAALCLAALAGLVACKGPAAATAVETGEKHEVAAGHEEHAGHDGHDAAAEPAGHGHDGHAGEAGGEAEHAEDIIVLDDHAQQEFGIEMVRAAAGTLTTFVELPGEITINSDRMVHIVPRVSAIVRKVNKTLGDQVNAGETLAELESRDLAELKMQYLSARERYSLTKEIFAREEKLWAKQISAEQDYLNARQAMAEAGIELRAAEQRLHLLGFTDEELERQAGQADAVYPRYTITAPFAGTVIEKHITMGEVLKEDAEIFTIADFSTVWVDINVYQQDLAKVEKGQTAVIVDTSAGQEGEGTISFVGPIVGETTRTAPARIVLDNRDGRWRPGMFITARIATGSKESPLLIRRSALQTMDGQQVVFVRTGEGFAPQPVVLGDGDREYVEVADGLAPGQEYVSTGSFVLKAQLSKSAFGDGHNH